MPRYEIALIPDAQTVQVAFAYAARTYFKDSADNYLLGDDAYVHVTLCQFHAASQEAALDHFNKLNNKKPIELEIGDFQLRPGSGLHIGKSWADFLIKENPALIDMQADSVQQLAAHGVASCTAVDGYTPHISMARLDGAPTALSEVLAPIAGKFLFRPHLYNPKDFGALNKPDVA